MCIEMSSQDGEVAASYLTSALLRPLAIKEHDSTRVQSTATLVSSSNSNLSCVCQIDLSNSNRPDCMDGE